MDIERMWLRVAKDNLKACIPYKAYLRRIKRNIWRYRSHPDNDELALEKGIQLVEIAHVNQLKIGVVLEVGTGWIPTIPHIFLAYGAKRIILTDVERLCDVSTFNFAKKLVERSLDRITKACAIDREILLGNLRRTSIFDYRCPPRLEEITENSIDLVYSRAVLEHIPKSMLIDLLLKWKKLLKPGGYCIHFIDNSDHFEHQDKSLSRLNFLTMPDWLWKIACFNPQNFQNRLRHSEYVELFQNAGYDLVSVEGKPDSQALADLEHLALNRKFAPFDKKDLAILSSLIVCRKSDNHEAASNCGGAVSWG